MSRLGDRTLTVSYAEPKQSEMNQDQVKSVYVGGLTASANKDSLQAFFESLDNIGEVKDCDYAGLAVFRLGPLRRLHCNTSVCAD